MAISVYSTNIMTANISSYKIYCIGCWLVYTRVANHHIVLGIHTCEVMLNGNRSLVTIVLCIVCISVHRGMLWILGEYCTSVEEIMRVIVEIRTALGEVNML